MHTRNSPAFYESREDRQSELQILESHSIDFPLHLHTDLELFLVRSGCMEVTVGDASAKLTAGGFAVIFPNTIHSYACRIPQSEYTMAVCQPSLLGGYLERLVRQRPRCPFLTGERLHPDIPYAMHGLYLQERTSPNREIYRAFVQLILARVFTEMELEPVKEAPSIDLTKRLVGYLSRHFQEPLSLEALARELAVSKYHLSHVFSERLHTSFHEYLHFLRLNYAKELLGSTGQTMLDVALNCGFSSQRTFNRVFQEHFGMTPRQYRDSQKRRNAEGKEG